MPADWRLLSPSHPTEFARDLGECDFLVVANHLALAPKSPKSASVSGRRARTVYVRSQRHRHRHERWGAGVPLGLPALHDGEA
jgi:hypothetical protein